MTHAEFKRLSCSKAKQSNVAAKFRFACHDRKSSIKASDSWIKRVSNNITGFYDPRKAKVVS